MCEGEGVQNNRCERGLFWEALGAWSAELRAENFNRSVDSLVSKNDSIQRGLCVEGTRVSRREGATEGLS